MSVKQDRLAMPSVPKEIEPKVKPGSLRGAFGALNAVDDVGLVDDKAQEARDSLDRGLLSGTTDSQSVSGTVRLALKQVEQDTEKGKKKEQDALFEATLRVQEYLTEARARTDALAVLVNQLRIEAEELRNTAQGYFDQFEAMVSLAAGLQAKADKGEPLPNAEREKALKEIQEARKKLGIKGDVDPEISHVDLIILLGDTAVALRDAANVMDGQAVEKDEVAAEVAKIVKELEAVANNENLSDEQKRAAYEKIFEDVGNAAEIDAALDLVNSPEIKDLFKEYNNNKLESSVAAEFSAVSPHAFDFN